MDLPGKLLRAVFNYHQYIVPSDEQQITVVHETFLSLASLQQQILTQYYSTNSPLRSLHSPLGISFSKLNREFHRAMHILRVAANRPYREAHEKITS
jgi:hypothetical protein